MEELLIKYIAGSATSEERDQVLNWIRQRSENLKIFDEVKDIWEISNLSQNREGFDAEKSWQKVKARYEAYKRSGVEKSKFKTESQKWLIPLLKVAAVALLFYFIGAFSYHFFIPADNETKINKEVAYNEIVVPRGSKTKINLIDGTTVWLNAGSKLRYPSQFSENFREVFLEGEAYFNVKKADKNKFIVHASEIDVKVYGTEFNVKAYPDENSIETTVVKGLVAVEKNIGTTAKSLYLYPNQRITISKSNQNITREKVDQTVKKGQPTINPKTETTKILQPKIVDPVLYTSWKDTCWRISSEEFQALAVKLERRYDVKIVFKDEMLKKYKFTGSLKDETLDQVMSLIKISSPINFAIEGKFVYLSENKKFRKTFDNLLINK